MKKVNFSIQLLTCRISDSCVLYYHKIISFIYQIGQGHGAKSALETGNEQMLQQSSLISFVIPALLVSFRFEISQWLVLLSISTTF